MNTSDLSIIHRIEDTVQKLNDLTKEAGKVASEADTEDGLTRMSEALKDIDTRMRELVDYIFDYPVADKCVDGGSMYDPFNGKFRWEYILDKLMRLYEDNLKSEYKKMQNRMAKHTAKYTR